VGGLITERTARALLSRVAEPGDPRVSRLVREEGGLGAVGAIRSAVADDASWARRYAARLAGADPEADLARVRAVGGRLLVPGDLEWPSQLADLGDAVPWALWVRGTVDLRLTALRSVAVVGARAATDYGTHVASVLGAELASHGWAVVSGGAFGIDAAAHTGALAARGVTVAVLACGVDVAYPPRHEALFARIAADGALVSEVAPGAAPHRTRFLVRNRVIAALTRGTVVVEAALRSGALATARDAERLGRPLMVVPGPVTSALSAGVHRELRAGALAVTSATEVIEAVGELGADLAPRVDGPSRPRDQLDPLSRRVLDGVPARRAATLESVARTAGVTPAEASAALGLLELAGFVRSGPDGWCLARTPGAPG
jgi:DNA processing protein